MSKEEYRGFKRFVIVTVVSVYLLILAGGVVRTTGSGMGCPDWPKCFERWVPPTDISELPLDYKERYKALYGHVTEFNALKTWIEYINRLLGALIGIFILAAFVLSLRYKKDTMVARLCGLALLLVILEGIVGKYVVSTNLKPILISFHLWGSILVILLLIYVMSRVRREELELVEIKNEGKIKVLTYLLIVTTVVQIVLGTQVRQQIDTLSVTLGFEQRILWIENLNFLFDIHRMFSLGVFGLHVYYCYIVFSSGSSKVTRLSIYLIAILVLIEMIGGFIMGNFDIPAVVQPIHMLAATMLLGVQFFMLFLLQFKESKFTKNIS
jgi:heme a synthase